VLRQHIEALGRQATGLAHSFERFDAMQLDLSGVTCRCFGGVDESGAHVVILEDRPMPENA
jgi:hypothetical protein